MQQVSTRAGGATIVADVSGSGPCVVLLHAGVADRRQWHGVIKVLSPHFRCIAYDRRGFGLTSAPDEKFRHIDDLDAILRYLGCQTAHLIGSSQGGRIAIDYALAFPGNVQSLILVAPALTGAPPPPEFPADIAKLMADLDDAEAAADFDRMNAIEAQLWLDGPLSPAGRVGTTIRSLFLEMNSIALRHKALTKELPCASALGNLQRISVPTLVMWGTADFPHVQQRAQLISESIPGAERLVMPGLAHLLDLEEPARFNSAVVGFLVKA